MNFSAGKADVETVIKWLAAALLWLYIIYRAIHTGITQDEAYSYFLVKTNYGKALVGTANTHWLNSIFMKLFLWLPGADDPWKLRMLSVLSWPVYAYTTIRFSKLFKNKWLGFLFFLFAVLNPFLIFYFSMGRGYAAACTFIMLSLWRAAEALLHEDFKNNTWFSIFVFASLAVIANFTAFYFYLCLAFVYLLCLFQNGQLRNVRQPSARKVYFLIAAVAVFAVSELLFIKYYTGDLEFGGDADLVKSLFGSLVAGGVHIGATPAALQVTGFLVFVLLMIAFCFTFYQTLTLKRKMQMAAFSVFICAGIVLLNGCFHLFFKTPYLIERTALILYPLLVTGLFFLLDTVAMKRQIHVLLIRIPALVIMVLLFFNFYKSFSLIYFKEWPVQTNTRDALEYLRSKGAKNVGLHYWHYSVYINYYTHAFPGRYNFDYEIINEKKLRQLHNSAPLSKLQYLLLAPPDTAVNQIPGNWQLKCHFPESGTKLLVKTNDTTSVNP